MVIRTSLLDGQVRNFVVSGPHVWRCCLCIEAKCDPWSGIHCRMCTSRILLEEFSVGTTSTFHAQAELYLLLLYLGSHSNMECGKELPVCRRFLARCWISLPLCLASYLASCYSFLLGILVYKISVHPHLASSFASLSINSLLMIQRDIWLKKISSSIPFSLDWLLCMYVGMNVINYVRMLVSM